MAILHDAFRIIASQNVAAASSAGASTASTTLGPQTYWVLLSVAAAYTATGGVRFVIGDGTPTASATSTLLVVNYPMIFACTPGQKVAVISNDTTAQTVSLAELM